ncbi:ATP-binding protein [Nitriliruptor alkaliphilus]|uniref:ATP-binding protein n=1 Tax=Nitriliruptor alkaliphilus TaxID=427918 RepID=UPI00069711A2|nr:ATP-binding protein [Nitriliruptor alkaliphilus]
MSIADRLRLGSSVGLCVALAVGLAGLAALTLLTRQVSALINQEQPLAEAHVRMLQGMTDAETAEQGYLITGEDVSLAPFEAGLATFRDAAGTALDEAPDGRVRRLLETEIVAAERWIDEFAIPIVQLRAEDPDAAIRRARDADGRTRFEVFRGAHAVTALELDERLARAERLATRTGTVTRIVLALLILGGGALLVAVARRTHAATVGPLAELAATLDQLRDDRDVRADVQGPAEIRAVATAVNRLAEENQRFADERTQIVARLEELDQQKSDFVSTVSHELRTPLTSIIGYLEMLEDGDAGPLNDEQLDLLAVGQRNAGRLLALIEDLLTLSRIESGKLRRDVAPVDLAALVGDVTAELRPRVAGRDLALTVDAAPAVVHGDRGHLERVLFNLVGNALKFTPAGGEVTVSSRRGDGEVVLAVRDSGIGIPEDEIDRLFDRFFRASTATDRAIPGTGLGLAITGLLVEQHGGRIDVDSVAGVGTTVTVRLPTVDQEVAA